MMHTQIPEQYAVIGSDDEFMADRQAEEWFRELQHSFAEEVEVIDGRAQSVAEVEQCIARFTQAAQNLSLFGDKKVIWFRQVSFLGDNASARAEGTKAAIAGLSETLERFNDPSTYLLLSASTLDRRKALAKQAEKGKHLSYHASEKNGEHLLRIIADTCRELNIQIDEEASIALIDRVSRNTRMLVNEIHKLATYVISEEDRRIHYNLVNEMVSQFGETEFFEMADTFYDPDLNRALHSVRKHFFTHKDARPLLANLQNRNRLLIQLRSLRDGQWLSPGKRPLNAGDLDKARDAYGSLFEHADRKTEFHPFGQNPWYLNRLATLANQISLRALIDIQLALVDTFSSLLDHPNEHELQIRNLVIDAHRAMKNS